MSRTQTACQTKAKAKPKPKTNDNLDTANPDDRQEAVPEPEPPRGLHCPRCGCGHLPVIYTRQRAGGRIMRRRECRHCGRRWTTWERIGGAGAG